MTNFYTEGWFWFLCCIALGYWAYRLFIQVKSLKFNLKSKSIIHGQSFEQLVPFMKDYPFNPRNTKFLGKPIDLIAFEDDKIVFIEVKTGGSKLSEKENRIKKLIESKQIQYYLINA